MSYIKSKSFKIVSRFYVIYGDYDPVYVGYTNRTVKQRFKEHQKDKDFSDYENVEVKELIDEKLSFDFTWDYEQTCKNADQVSIREGQLVQKYGTQDSEFQKADGGGQTWATEKGFVKSNKDNPRFDGLSGAEIKEKIDKEKIISRDIIDFVSSIKPRYRVDISSFVGNMNLQYQVDTHNFVSRMKSQYRIDIGSFVKCMKPQYKADISNFVANMKIQYRIDISDFVHHMELQYRADIGSFVNRIKSQYKVDIDSFVGNMKHQYQLDTHNFVNHMEPQYRVDIGHFVGHMMIQYKADISHFVGNM